MVSGVNVAQIPGLYKDKKVPGFHQEQHRNTNEAPPESEARGSSDWRRFYRLRRRRTTKPPTPSIASEIGSGTIVK